MVQRPLIPSFWEDATIEDLLSEAAHRYETDALWYDGTGIDYQRLLTRVRRCARGLREGGVRSGDRVAVLVEDRPEWVYSVFGAAILGADPVFLTTRYGSRELSHAIEVTDTTTLIVQDRTPEADLLTDKRRLLLGTDPESGRGPPERTVADQLETVVTVDPTRRYEDTIEFRTLMATGRETTGIDDLGDELAPTDTAAILFTSGTTSMPKAVIRTHRNLLSHAVDLGNWYGIRPGDAVLDLFPNPSITATNQLLMTLAHGGTYYLIDHYDPDAVMDILTHQRLAWVSGVDTMFADILDHPAIEDIDTASLKRIAVALVGGIDPDLGRRVESVFGAPLENAYGMSETNAFTLRSKPDHPFEVRLHSGGKPAYKTGIRVETDLENHAEPAEPVEGPQGSPDELIGEFCVNGITVTPGYDNNESANDDAFDENGWFHTSDTGSLRWIDGEYFFVFEGRLDDMFQVGGNNVSPNEVESVIVELDGVSWAGVIGIDHDRLGSVPAAFIAREEGAEVAPGEVTEFCASQLASYKVPRTVFVIEPSEIPTEAGVNGKKLRRDRLRHIAEERLTDRSGTAN